MALRTLVRYLTQTGLPTGEKDHVVGGPGIYNVIDPLSTMVVDRFWISYQDGTGGGLDEYANLGTAMAAITLKHWGPGFVEYNDLTDGVSINSNGDWARVCDKFDHFVSLTDDVWKGVWIFDTPIHLPPGHYLEIEIGGSLAGMVNQYAGVSGFYLDGPTPWAP